MKNRWSTVAVLIGGLLLVSCDDSKGPAFVYGSLSITPGGSDNAIEGDLSKSSGADYYGFCKYEDGQFSFVVGHANMNELTVSDSLYISVTGIVGPGPEGAPEEGVFDAAGRIKSGQDYVSTYSRAQVAAYSSDTFVVYPDNGCQVSLFAVPVEGEVIPDNNHTFEYYVRMNCQGLSNVYGSQNANVGLTGFTAEFYFDNC